MTRARSGRRLAAWTVLLAACGTVAERRGGTASPPATAPPTGDGLRPPSAFAGIADPAARSQAMFGEIARVLLHPRCANCHPADDSPRQGDAALLHDPPVSRGPDNHGVVAMTCGSCHQDRNLDHARVPGAPGWHLAPIEMAWLGKSVGHVCAQIKDPARNGGKTLAQIHDHMAHDELVAWGWTPGADRVPAPGSQAELGALVAAWIETGAVCPPDATAEVTR
jgi:hypothetical protein